MKCLTRLPPEQREVIVLKIWHELTFELIGEMLGISPNTASGRYRYGMKKLRDCLTTHATHENESTGTFGEDGIKLEAAAAR